jgi:hypothetical protein
LKALSDKDGVFAFDGNVELFFLSHEIVLALGKVPQGILLFLPKK